MGENWGLLIALAFAAFFIVVAIVGTIRKLLSKCPRCGCKSWKVQTGEEKIPGSEETVEYMPSPHEGLRRETRAKFRVTYRCRHCGYELSETQTRIIRSV
jgi:ribosomal protein L37E